VLLVRQRLQRCRVEDLASIVERERDRVFGDECLARAGRRRDEDRPPAVERVEGAQLKVVERERSCRSEHGPRVNPHGGLGLEAVRALRSSVSPATLWALPVTWSA